MGDPACTSHASLRPLAGAACPTRRRPGASAGRGPCPAARAGSAAVQGQTRSPMAAAVWGPEISPEVCTGPLCTRPVRCAGCGRGTARWGRGAGDDDSEGGVAAGLHGVRLTVIVARLLHGAAITRGSLHHRPAIVRLCRLQKQAHLRTCCAKVRASPTWQLQAWHSAPGTPQGRGTRARLPTSPDTITGQPVVPQVWPCRLPSSASPQPSPWMHPE